MKECRENGRKEKRKVGSDKGRQRGGKERRKR